LVGQEAQVLVRPRLLINGRKASVGLLKNCTVTLTIHDYLDSPEISRTFQNLTFKDAEETVISFQVPPNLKDISLQMEAQVQNTTKNKLESFSSSGKKIKVQHHVDARICELYLRKVGQEYFVFVLGRNGEPQRNQTLEVRAWHKDAQGEAHTRSGTTDKQGKIGLGQLKDITKVQAETQANQTGS
jgi:hypothetical protein